MIPEKHLATLRRLEVGEQTEREIDRMYRLTEALTGDSLHFSAIAFYAYLTDGRSVLGERLRRHVRENTSIAAVEIARVQAEIRKTHALSYPHIPSELDRIATHLREEFQLNTGTAARTAALLEPILLNPNETRATIAPLFGVGQEDFDGRARLARELLRVAADPRPVIEVPGRYVLTVSYEENKFQADVTEALARGRIVESLGGVEIPGEVRFPMRAVFVDPLRDVLGEFEDLINSKKATEAEFQRFFERHPELLCMLGSYDDVRSQVTVKFESAVTPLSGSGFRPDFLLRNSLSGNWDLLDIKKARQPRLIAGRGLSAHDSRRPSEKLARALSQMREYRRALDQLEARASLKARYGIVVSQPTLILLMGLEENFPDVGNFERSELMKAVSPDVELVTYDQLFRVAEHRRLS